VANLNTGTSVVGSGQQVMVFPFRNPNYAGQELFGVGEAFSNAIWGELQQQGISAVVAPTDSFPATKIVDHKEACRYGKAHGADIVLIGIVTEWIDGATNWSGKRDVAAAMVTAYSTTDGKFVAAASGRQNGTWFTLVNAPTTRFLPTLSKEIVRALLGRSAI
jgi:hypothetical protein